MIRRLLLIGMWMVTAIHLSAQVCEWKSGEFTAEWTEHVWNFDVSNFVEGENSITFLYTSGSNKLCLKDVNIVADGRMVWSDTTEMSAGTNPKSAVCRFSLESMPKELTLTANVRTLGGTNSNGVIYINGFLIIPEGTTEIRGSQFRGQTDLSSVQFPSSLKSIGGNAFRETALVSAVLPEGLESIGTYAFYDCHDLEVISFPGTLLSIPASCFTNATSLKEVVINEGVSEIEEYAFNNNSSLSKVHIPASVKKIGDMAFRNCVGIEELVLEEGIEEIGREAFSSCGMLSKVEIPESVKSIGYVAFPQKATLIVTAGSEAHKYAVEYGYKYETIGEGELNFEELALTTNKLLANNEFMHYANVRTPHSAQAYVVGDKGSGGGVVFFADESNNTYLEVKRIEGTLDWATATMMALDEKGGGFSDWRLPSSEELELIYNERENLGIDFGTMRYWSLTRDGLKNTPYVWFLDFSDGKSYHNAAAGLSAQYGVVLVRTISENLVVESDGNRYELSPYLGMWNHADALVVAEAYSELTGEEWSLPTANQMAVFNRLQVVSAPHNGVYWMNGGDDENSSYFDLSSGIYGSSASRKVRYVRLVKVSNASDVTDFVYLHLKTHWNQNGDYRLAFTDDTYMGCGNLAIAQILLYHHLLPKSMTVDLSKVECELTETTPQENKLETSRYIYAVSSKKVVENFDVERRAFAYPTELGKVEMERLIVEELAGNRPMMLHCYTADKSSDHAMVLDGARFVDGRLQVHLLFGWRGDYDGWLYLWEPINTTMINLDNEYRGIETYLPMNDNAVVDNQSNGDITLYTLPHTIVVENATSAIRVYDSMGRLIARRDDVHIVSTIDVKDSGVYIVEIGGVSQKVLVE
ncbi:MAG: leucine-rich repeat protein [Paludibacteraceae bacterium]|nr:leucine-rich repeat protein [Paludibacteraceae bacterium]